MPWDYRQPEPAPKKPKNPRQWLLWAAIVLSTAMALYGVIRLVGYGLDWFSSKQTSQELREIATRAEESTGSSAEEAAPESAVRADPVTAAPLPTETPLPTQAPALAAAAPAENTARLPQVTYPSGMKVNPKIQALRKKSECIVGWLTLEGVDEAVVLRDNTYFLNHDALGHHNDNGALFLDEGTELLTRPYTLLVYGHNMKTGAMFGNLKKFEDSAYCYQHRFVQFDTLFETGEYEIFAVSVINLVPGLSRYLSLSDLESPVRSVRRAAIHTLQSLSSVPALTQVSEEDQLLLLITCVGNDDERLVVAARRMEERTEKAAR